MANKRSEYLRTGVYAVEEIIDCIGPGRPKLDLDGDKVSVGGVRLRTFLKGTVCVSCGIKATHFAKEKHKKGNAKSFHLNLYGMNEYGHETMFTKDHIIPRSKGGPDTIDNMQPMCAPCNQRKGNGDKHTSPRYRYGHREYTIWECYNPNTPNKPRFYDARLVETKRRNRWAIARAGVVIAPTAKQARKQYVREAIAA